MFKSIEYRHHLFITLLIITVVATTYFIIKQDYPWASVCGILIIISIHQLNNTYRRYNENFNFLLNALDNGDYSFHFTTNKLSLREKELNMMMNWIKEILTNAKKEVIENENYLSIIMESVPTGVIIIDERGIIHSVNQSALKTLGLSIFTHINQLKAINETYPLIFHQLKAGDNYQIPILTEKEEIQVSIQVSQIKLKRGKMRVITLNNIGNELESKEMESWIRLIRVMTHEIMNSVAPITSLSETMISLNQSKDIDADKLKENTSEAFETIKSTAAGLTAFVESYRKFTAIPTPKKSTFDLALLIEKIIQLHDSKIKEKQIEVVFEKEKPNQEIHADPNLLNQVLMNLIKNGIEAIEENEEIKKIKISFLDNDGKTIINVSDSGKPIPEDVLPNIFIPFFTTKSSGSGIGLSISRQIIRLHGGKLQHFVNKEGMNTFQISLLNE